MGTISNDIRLLDAEMPLSSPHRDTVGLKQFVCEETVRACVANYGQRLRSVVLTGSLARDEATFIFGGHEVAIRGDVEFLLVFDSDTRLPSSSETDLLRDRIERELLLGGLSAHIDLATVRPSFLQQLPAHIFSYELCACGQVVWGDSEILSLAPKFAANEISKEDAWRMLCNRIIEQLEFAGHLQVDTRQLSPSLHYRTVKLYLDTATSLLVFLGEYKPSYGRRAQRLSVLAATPPTAVEPPFDLQRFATRVAECTAWKLRGGADNILGLQAWEEAVGYARLLWRWELAQLTGAEGQRSNQFLLQRFLRKQRWSQKARAWMYALRRQGWHRSWRDWPRWVALSVASTPRYHVYGVAFELFSRWPCMLKQNGELPHVDVDWNELAASLPKIPSDSRLQPATWRRLARDVVWNYQQFLMDTRA